MATVFVPAYLKCFRPMPPPPITPLVRWSLGARKPLPRTCRGTMEIPPSANKEPFIKLLREFFIFSFMEIVKFLIILCVAFFLNGEYIPRLQHRQTILFHFTLNNWENEQNGMVFAMEGFGNKIRSKKFKRI